jgi:nucleoside 2-deoxyribosyltransferase
MIYFAAPLFNKAELSFNTSLTTELEAEGFQVFLPQRDGVEADKHPYLEMTREERRRTTFEMDRDKVIECDIFLFLLDGRVPDEGACVELGIAYTHRMLTGCDRFIVGLHTDCRAAFMGSRLNPMLGMAIDVMVESGKDLMVVLKKREEVQRAHGSEA